MQALQEDAADSRAAVAELRAEFAALKSLVAAGAVATSTPATATAAGTAAAAAADQPDSDAAAAASAAAAAAAGQAAAASAATATLSADMQRYKDRFAVHEAKEANLSKRVEVEVRSLRDGVKRLTEAHAPVATGVLELRADYGVLMARADAAAGANDAVHAEVVRSHSCDCAILSLEV